MLKRYFEFSLIYKIAIGFILGIVLGFILGPSASVLDFFGEIFIRLLKMIVMPIILFTIIVGAASISPKSLGRVGGKIFIYYMITTTFAIIIGLVLGNVFQPGEGLSLPPPPEFNPDIAPLALKDVFLGIIPTNPFGSLSSGEPLPVIFFALIFGLGLSFLKDSGKGKIKDAAHMVYDGCQVAAEIIFKITRGVLEYAPFGILAIMAGVIGERGAEVLGPFMKLIVLGYAGMTLHILLVYGGFLLLFRINPIKFLKGSKEAMITAYTSRTSSGTLPVSLSCAEENLGVSNRVCSFTLPLGATINMDGTAIYMVLECIFAANLFGVELTISQQIVILVTILLSSIGTAGVPSASLVLLTGVLKAVKLPLNVIPMFAGFDPICDMMRTMTNVTGDLVGTVVVAKTEGELNTNTGVWVGDTELDGNIELE